MTEKGTYLFVVYIDCILKLSMIVSVSKLVMYFTPIISDKTIKLKKSWEKFFLYFVTLLVCMPVMCSKLLACSFMDSGVFFCRIFETTT